MIPPAQFYDMVHKRIRLLGRTLENASLLQAGKFILVDIVVMHRKLPFIDVALFGRIGHTGNLHDSLGSNDHKGGIQLGTVHPHRIRTGNVIYGRLALAHVGKVQVAAIEQVQRHGQITKTSIVACRTPLRCGKVALLRTEVGGQNSCK